LKPKTNPSWSIRFKFKKNIQRPAGGITAGCTRTSGMKAVMIVRAVFWIGLVALLMPREPNLGLGRPDLLPASATILSSAADALPSDTPAGTVTDCEAACAGSPGIIQRLGLGPDGTVTQGLAQVKAQIDADIARRKQGQRHSL
jgi:hypothetical protein